MPRKKQAIDYENRVMQAGKNVIMWVGMDYPGSVISVNGCYAHGPNGRKYLRKEARSWRRTLQDSFGWLVKAQQLQEAHYASIRVQIDGYYQDEYRSLDADNLFKLTWDAVKKGIGVDDRFFQPATGIKSFGHAIPYIVVTVFAELAGEESPPVVVDTGGVQGDEGREGGGTDAR